MLDQILNKLRDTFALQEAKNLLKPLWLSKNKKSNIHSTGFCYIATEALFHLLGGSKSKFFPMRITLHIEEEKISHWYLFDGINYIDPTYDQFNFQVNYQNGQKAGFLTGYEKMSKRCNKLINIMLTHIYAQKITPTTE